MDYKKVIDGYRSGAINRNEWQLVMDNDGGYWQYIGDNADEDEVEKATARMEETYGTPDGYRDIVNVLVGAGVNCDWC